MKTMQVSLKKIPPYISFPLVFAALCATLALLHLLGGIQDSHPTNEPPPTPVTLPYEGTIGIDETLALQGVTITLHSIVADYRCPADAQCIEAGAIVANVTFESGSLRETFNMPSDEVPRPFGAYRVSIIDIAPQLLSSTAVDPQAYRVTFQTRQMTETEAVESYLRTNISMLSPEPAVLGGTFYVTEVVFPETGKTVVSYEDGHIALVADVIYDISPTEGVTVREFTVRTEE